MPVLVLPKELEYKGFVAKLNEIDVFRISSTEETRELVKKNILLQKAPRPQDLIDDVRVYYNFNGYRLKTRTTIRETPFKVSKKDSAWVIIENEQGKAVMFAPPMHRTEHFLSNLLMQIKVFKRIIENRPMCTCGSDMNIEKNGLRDFQWKCSTGHIKFNHTASQEVYAYVYEFLSADEKKYLRKKISKEKYSKKKAEESGNVYGQAVLNRKSWIGSR